MDGWSGQNPQPDGRERGVHNTLAGGWQAI